MIRLNRKVRIAAALVIALVISVGALSRGGAQASFVVNMDFEYLRQGTAGVVTLSGPDMVGGVVNTLDRSFPFFPVTGGFAALISVPFNQRIRKDYPLSITIYRADGSSVTSNGVLRVESGEFIREPDFVIPANRFYLLNPVIQQNEDLRLEKVYGVVTPERFWEGQFTPPANGRLSSPFGAVRTFNDGTTRRHLGLDLVVPQGTPVLASASGRVVFARAMDIHGNIIIVDHGWGVFSSYSHLRDIFVVPGQMVLQGDVLGLSGNTGRSTGPHIHWEIAVNGNWINPQTFTGVKLPT